MDHRDPVRISRRTVLGRVLRASAGAALALPLAGCGVLRADDAEGLSFLDAATPGTSPPVPTAAPGTPSGTPGALPAFAAKVAVTPPRVGQGETGVLALTHRGATGGHVDILGQRIPLIRHDESLLWCVFGVGLFQPLGGATAFVTIRDASGAVLGEVEHPFEVVHVDRPVDYLVASPEVTAVLTPEAAEIEEALRAYEQFNLFGARPRWSGSLILPVKGGFQTTAFGQGRSLNGGPVTNQHGGVDLANDMGTPILSAAAGRIAWVGAMPIHGNSVLVDHGAGVVTGYHHLQEWLVDLGQTVSAGEVIAHMGSTGFSTGPHLHWEMTIYGVNVDPMTWVKQAFLPVAP